ncbi:hypothetical protein F1737_08985 [Methanoplanus sp. FWC-SCC4]|uniref:Uncharacterized protein n=1 Tax=Methanochimaera problematica TaxID=2609417 RepID=A0AA97I4S7_9EURY|nr:hypothetical protein [Methanoplanus sp. FWC-SCC4]WOF16814.1 hypothetical protein F1737_08985 [Methanoplanus sp. FWC-SCC4]
MINNNPIIDNAILKKIKMPLSYYCEFQFYVLYRRLICCKTGKHRFVFVEEDDQKFCSLQPGNYYCQDCGKKAPPSEIFAYYNSGSDVWGTEEYDELMMKRVLIKGACKFSQEKNL